MTGARDRNSASRPAGSSDGASAGHFQTTLWTLVLHAAQSDSRAHDALAQLCRTYWYPLYAFVRRQGRQPADAQDLTQAFFARLLEKEALGRVDRSKGKFRSFLLASLKNFLANEWDKDHAQKRGGGCEIISLDGDSAESRYGLEPSHNLSAERIFERRWALTLLDQVLARLRAEYESDGKAALFAALKETLTAGPSGAGYATIGEQLGATEGAVKIAAHRLRKRYRELIRAEIAETVDSPEDVDDELRSLLRALRD